MREQTRLGKERIYEHSSILTALQNGKESHLAKTGHLLHVDESWLSSPEGHHISTTMLTRLLYTQSYDQKREGKEEAGCVTRVTNRLEAMF